MTLELWMLLGSALLLFVLVTLQAMQSALILGFTYPSSNREEPRPVQGAIGRIDRAVDNLRENILLFTPVVLVLAIIGVSTDLSKLGAILFLAARIVHAVTYILGIIYVRSLAWMVGIFGMGMMLSALL